ncbi:HEAT repeat domain-containing protein [Planctomicrobium piriforme]|uniref:HEAT repeat-containing protein n=1 Tax=Planctomicrobium piriforme TaxID=1576369 RepID=A0A1I3IDY2_9PLAN|nr:HEAT repeat domain-containing protein [Planctomicrobium piriforme]SFI46235.1 HEAT repeat-containing protein [Planctomicrobium piriforme]
MTRTIITVLFCGLLTLGCGDSSATPERKTHSTSPAVLSRIDEIFKSWPNKGMWLPDEKEISFFRSNFDQSRGALAKALSNKEPKVRMRAAYVIDKIGPEAKSFGPDLIDHLQSEDDEVVRMYLVNALGSIEFRDPAALAVLRQRFDSLSAANVPPRSDLSYAEVDEKINTAAALYRLDLSPQRLEYLNFVLQWLHPPSETLSPADRTGYWERRWVAVTSLERMRDAKDAIPLLEAMEHEPKAKMWVSVHVPRVLGVLRKADAKQ